MRLEIEPGPLGPEGVFVATVEDDSGRYGGPRLYISRDDGPCIQITERELATLLCARGWAVTHR